jgi:ATP-binding cassette subfamily B protein
MADLIIVLDNGMITEAGAHQELLSAGGPYAELFELQARSYR